MRNHFLCLIFVAVPAASAIAQGRNFKVKRDENDPTRFICDIGVATFTNPEGWIPKKSNVNTVAVLTRSNEGNHNLTQMISIDVGKPFRPTAREMADSFALMWKGKVTRNLVDLDGETAYRIKLKLDPRRLEPIDCVIAVKNERVVMLIGAGSKSEGLATAIDALVASWKWIVNQ